MKTFQGLCFEGKRNDTEKKKEAEVLVKFHGGTPRITDRFLHKRI